MEKNWLLVPPSIDAFQMLMKTCSVATKHKWIRSIRFKLPIQDKTFPPFSQYSSGPAGVYEEWGTLGFRSQAPWLPHQSEASGLHTHKLVVLRSLILCLILSVWCGTLRTGPRWIGPQGPLQSLLVQPNCVKWWYSPTLCSPNDCILLSKNSPIVTN